MSYQIIDTPNALKIIWNGTARYFIKQQIREISVVKNNNIQLDLGTKKVFIPFTDITAPLINSAEALVEVICDFVYSDIKKRQSDILQQLVGINTNGADILTNANNFNTYNNPQKSFLRITDDKNPNVIYNGYCQDAQIAIDEAFYIIERITIQDGITMHQFPDGINMQYIHKWADRENINYI